MSFFDGLDVFDVLFDGGWCRPKRRFALADELERHAKVNPHGFGVPDVQIAVRLRRPARVTRPPNGLSSVVLDDGFADKVRGSGLNLPEPCRYSMLVWCGSLLHFNTFRRFCVILGFLLPSATLLVMCWTKLQTSCMICAQLYFKYPHKRNRWWIRLKNYCKS